MVTSTLTVTYDSEADAAYVYVVPRGQGRSVARTAVANIRMDRASINVDFAPDGTIAGFEILGASRVLPPSLLEDVGELG
jgi:uncharacterized protein YuzE